MSNGVIESFANRNAFLAFLSEISSDATTSGLFVKYTADWCNPCQQIKSLVDDWFSKLPPAFQAAELDVDENFDLYAYMKKMKQVSGIPTILYYKKGNTTYIPDDSVIGTDTTEINNFFNRICFKFANISSF